MADQVVEPGRMEVPVRPPFRIRIGDGAAEVGLQPGKAIEAGSCFGRRESRDGEQEAVMMEEIGLSLRQRLHRRPPAIFCGQCASTCALRHAARS